MSQRGFGPLPAHPPHLLAGGEELEGPEDLEVAEDFGEGRVPGVGVDYFVGPVGAAEEEVRKKSFNVQDHLQQMKLN